MYNKLNNIMFYHIISIMFNCFFIKSIFHRMCSSCCGSFYRVVHSIEWFPFYRLACILWIPWLHKAFYRMCKFLEHIYHMYSAWNSYMYIFSNYMYNPSIFLSSTHPHTAEWSLLLFHHSGLMGYHGDDTALWVNKRAISRTYNSNS